VSVGPRPQTVELADHGIDVQANGATDSDHRRIGAEV
jgi:hypothetical protein